MKTYTLITYDDTIYRITEEQANIASKKRDASQTIQFKDYPGEFIMPGNVKSIGLAKKSRQGSNLGSSLQITAEELFALPSGQDSTGFWFTITKINQERHKDGKPWVYGFMIDHVRSIQSIAEPNALMEFIDSEWDNLESERYNKAKLPEDRAGNKQAREWLRTEDGKGYILSKGERVY